jgi:hypothetical protein
MSYLMGNLAPMLVSRTGVRPGKGGGGPPQGPLGPLARHPRAGPK